MGIANRDIKLENTLLMDLTERPVLKLCDFGYSKDELCASISKTMCGESPVHHSLTLASPWYQGTERFWAGQLCASAEANLISQFDQPIGTQYAQHGKCARVSAI